MEKSREGRGDSDYEGIYYVRAQICHIELSGVIADVLSSRSEESLL